MPVHQDGVGGTASIKSSPFVKYDLAYLEGNYAPLELNPDYITNISHFPITNILNDLAATSVSAFNYQKRASARG
jgi:hypothetical protein